MSFGNVGSQIMKGSVGKTHTVLETSSRPNISLLKKPQNPPISASERIRFGDLGYLRLFNCEMFGQIVAVKDYL